MIIDYPELVILPATRHPMSREDRRKKGRQLIIIRNQHPREYDRFLLKHDWITKGLRLPAHSKEAGYK